MYFLDLAVTEWLANLRQRLQLLDFCCHHTRNLRRDISHNCHEEFYVKWTMLQHANEPSCQMWKF